MLKAKVNIQVLKVYRRLKTLFKPFFRGKKELELRNEHFYFGGAGSKGFATLKNVSKLQFFDKIGQAKSVGFRFYSAI